MKKHQDDKQHHKTPDAHTITQSEPKNKVTRFLAMSPMLTCSKATMQTSIK